MKYLETGFKKMWRTLEITKCCLGNFLEAQKYEEIYCVYGLEDSVMSQC